LSSVYVSGKLSSSDAQRFGIRASSLLASYYPRYFGYYYLLGYEFMPRIRDLKDQQLYRIDKTFDYGIFTPLLNKKANIDIVQEQWDAMLHVTLSLKQRPVPAHVVVQRLTSSYPSDRLSKVFTNLGRIIKTQYILRYLWGDSELHRTIQRQLNKGEYRHKLPRRIFFADHGEFTTGDYEEIMNKASCLSLVSNAILYWNTIKINDIVENLRQQGEVIDIETLSHISLLPFKHVLPNGTYFIEDL
jgi:TnpA family transposase